MSEQKKAADAALSAVNRRAMELLELPADEREARYKVFREAYLESALELGFTRQKAREWADQMNEWTRALVKMIEQGGGAAGGKA